MAEAEASAAGPLNEPAPSYSPSASTPTSTQGQQPSPNFVAPSHYLRPRERAHGSKSRGPMSPLDHEQLDGLVSPPSSPSYLFYLTTVCSEPFANSSKPAQATTSYLSVTVSSSSTQLCWSKRVSTSLFRMVSIPCPHYPSSTSSLTFNQGIVSAPLWDSKTSTFAGLLTTSDYINVIQYYWQNPDALAQVDQFRLNSLRDIEKAIGVQPIETVSVHPLQSLYTACRRMLESRARRIPLVDVDDETQRAMIVSVLTQYRILKFVAVNVKDTQNLRKPLRDIDCGTYGDLQTATMETPVMDVIHLLVKYSISNVPILDSEGIYPCLHPLTHFTDHEPGGVVNVFEAVDVISLIKGGVYDDLNLTVGEALLKRSEVLSSILPFTVIIANSTPGVSWHFHVYSQRPPGLHL
jgi:5'-AMP-activated protein kinase regulatory gamma subunit